jgi:hypothetical protein
MRMTYYVDLVVSDNTVRPISGVTNDIVRVMAQQIGRRAHHFGSTESRQAPK